MGETVLCSLPQRQLGTMWMCLQRSQRAQQGNPTGRTSVAGWVGLGMVWFGGTTHQPELPSAACFSSCAPSHVVPVQLFALSGDEESLGIDFSLKQSFSFFSPWCCCKMHLSICSLKDFYWAGKKDSTKLGCAAQQAHEKEDDNMHCHVTANSLKHVSCWNDRPGFESNGAAAWVFSSHPLRENSRMFFTNKPDYMQLNTCPLSSIPPHNGNSLAVPQTPTTIPKGKVTTILLGVWLSPRNSALGTEP